MSTTTTTSDSSYDQVSNCNLLEKFLVANMVVKMAPCIATHKVSVIIFLLLHFA